MRLSSQRIPRGGLLGLPKTFDPRGLARIGESLEKLGKSMEEVVKSGEEDRVRMKS